jgi:formate hydrogenlyase subunit 3/multisubunit Na+/H+ antiporter MnhD subunit
MIVLLLASLLPGALTILLLAGGRASRIGIVSGPWALAGALLLALLPLDSTPLDVPWMLLGARFELDAVGRIFFIVAAALWTVAGHFARSYVPEAEQRRFFTGFLLTATGNLLLPLAADAATFYLAFALMTFAGYAMVVHTGTEEARRAGRVYIVLAVLGEGFLLGALLAGSHAAGSTGMGAFRSAVAIHPNVLLLTIALLVGFGIKAGAVPLHGWLPLAHPVAPTPASAVLSGSMIKGGLLGWLRFLPLGEISLPGLGTTVVLLGMIAAVFGVAIGLAQQNPKTVLAYSSISQMGVINVGIGLALAAPEIVPRAVAAVTVYAAHHGLAKGALFLGVGIAGTAAVRGRLRFLVLAGLLLPAVAVAGAPLTSGSVAKAGLKGLATYAPIPWPIWLEWFLPISSGATTLLMAHYLHLLILARTEAASPHPLERGMAGPWILLLVAVAVGAWILPERYPVGSGSGYAPTIGVIDLLPLLVGGVAFLALLRARAREGTRRWSVGAGDIVLPIERSLRRLPRLPGGEAESHPALDVSSRLYKVYARSDRHDLVLRLELLLTRWPPVVALLIGVMALLLFLVGR